MSRPSDHIDVGALEPEEGGEAISNGGPGGRSGQGPLGWLLFFWRQLTSMRVALLLLLLLAVAAIPGSLLPQRSSDPNGVSQWKTDHPDAFRILDAFPINAFDVYSSVWFSAIYILLFVSLIGCVVPRVAHHWRALRQRPPRTPSRLSRLPAFRTDAFPGISAERAAEEAQAILKRQRYRVQRYTGRDGEESVSAERGYMRETGNLVFHAALVGILVAVGFGGGLGFSGQKVVVEGGSFVNSLLDYDSFNPGRFFDDAGLPPYSLTLDKLAVTYVDDNPNAMGQPLDFDASVSLRQADGAPAGDATIKVNEPLRYYGTDVYLLGNGYAPTITVRDPQGTVVFHESVPFLPQDANLTSIGVVKVPDGLAQQLGMVGFFYPTRAQGSSGASFSTYPDLVNPVLTLNVYTGDLGLDNGVPRSVYVLDTTNMTEIAGTQSDTKALELSIGQSVALPGGLGSVSLDAVPRYASLEIHSDPSQGWVLLFAVLAVAGLLSSLLIPRRRVWVKARPDGEGVRVEYAGLARGDDPTLDRAVGDLVRAHALALGRPAESVMPETRMHS